MESLEFAELGASVKIDRSPILLLNIVNVALNKYLAKCLRLFSIQTTLTSCKVYTTQTYLFIPFVG